MCSIICRSCRLLSFGAHTIPMPILAHVVCIDTRPYTRRCPNWDGGSDNRITLLSPLPPYTLSRATPLGINQATDSSSAAIYIRRYNVVVVAVSMYELFWCAPFLSAGKILPVFCTFSVRPTLREE